MIEILFFDANELVPNNPEHLHKFKTLHLKNNWITI